MRTIQIALTGELDESVVAHRAIPRSLALAAAAVGCRVEARWVPTTELLPDAAALEPFDGHWCVPGSPYASLEGALAGIADSRERGRPFLGTCGGFQHALLEYARNVAGLGEAAHEEITPTAATLLISRLRCSLEEHDGRIHLAGGSRAARAYGHFWVVEGYHCNFGFNPTFRRRLEQAGLFVSGMDEAGDVRVIELPGHPFYVATLYQPERSALAGSRPHPLIAAFVEAARARAAGDAPAGAVEAAAGA